MSAHVMSLRSDIDCRMCQRRMRDWNVFSSRIGRCFLKHCVMRSGLCRILRRLWR